MGKIAVHEKKAKEVVRKTERKLTTENGKLGKMKGKLSKAERTKEHALKAQKNGKRKGKEILHKTTKLKGKLNGKLGSAKENVKEKKAKLKLTKENVNKKKAHHAKEYAHKVKIHGKKKVDEMISKQKAKKKAGGKVSLTHPGHKKHQ